MSRRVSLPGAEELFRTTSTTLSAVPAPSEERADESKNAATPVRSEKAAPVRTTARRRVSRSASAPSGRERHDEKITVYLSPEELFDLEQARLSLRGDMGLAVDRGRIVREAVAVIVADLEAKGESSILARRLRGQ
ncbi:MAG: hypothetical protein EBT44_01250 [Actinobacteria bacterium]|uniref:Uncharacterized protein n=1 Tax=Candidatus Fonsibacter lacus TaxID=2576439 RepID=A0A965GBW7_9PROT|nr:hypothetical protein [Candidatus Fonsibacter lacus]